MANYAIINYLLEKGKVKMQLDQQTVDFLKEREEKIGGKIIFRTYALYYLASTGEKREYGVFLYTDGNTFAFEDFDRPPTFLGIEIKVRNREKYVKMEHSFRKEDVVHAAIVTRSSAEKAVRSNGEAKEANGFSRFFRKTLLEIALEDGTAYYFELIDPKEIINLLK